MHAHDAGTGLPFLSIVVAVVASAFAAAYLSGVVVSRRRDRRWPWGRTTLWCGGVTVGAASVLAAIWPAGSGLRDHVGAHLLAIAAPILLVSAAPLTLAVRSMHPSRARRLSRMLRSHPFAVVAHPVTAGLVSAGGLWLLYATPLLSVVHASPVLNAAAHAHLIAAGCLFAAAVIGPDPRPRRAPG